MADHVVVRGGARADIRILDTARRPPLAGHTALHAMREIYAAICAHRTTLVFVNTRMQAEFVFQSCGASTRKACPSPCTTARSMPASGARWRGDDGGQPARRGVHLHARPRHRLGRRRPRRECRGAEGSEPPDAAHRPLQPSAGRGVAGDPGAGQPLRGDGVPRRARCRRRGGAGHAGAAHRRARRAGQHVLGMACAGGFTEDDLFAEVASAAPYAGLDRATFADVVRFVATGGYALASYERFAKIRVARDGLWRVTNPASPSSTGSMSAPSSRSRC